MLKETDKARRVVLAPSAAAHFAGMPHAVDKTGKEIIGAVIAICRKHGGIPDNKTPLLMHGVARHLVKVNGYCGFIENTEGEIAMIVNGGAGMAVEDFNAN